MKIATVVVATKSYLLPLEVCLRRIKVAINDTEKNIHHCIFLVTDEESEEAARGLLSCFDGSDVRTEVLTTEMQENGKHYDNDRQILIATLQSIGFDAARGWGCDLLWSVEADVLVPHNALSVSMQMLDFDSGYYDVAFVTYPSQGGGSFLGGNGDYRNNIAEDFIPEERKIPAKLKALYDACNARLDDDSLSHESREKEIDRIRRINKKIKECPPVGNVFELNAKKWRRRGWLDNSHPGTGRGAVIETDWTGLGCTLMSKKAAMLASFEGYDGGGTQDLFLNWHKWHPEGLKFCCITHTVCDHVVRNFDDKDEELILLKSYHEPLGETRGHLRWVKKPFHKFS
jgi:hypothetical protein